MERQRLPSSDDEPAAELGRRLDHFATMRPPMRVPRFSAKSCERGLRCRARQPSRHSRTPSRPTRMGTFRRAAASGPRLRCRSSQVELTAARRAKAQLELNAVGRAPSREAHAERQLASARRMEPPRLAAGRERPRRQGFSLIEVLVALVVLSVGLLGLAALQQNGGEIQRRGVHTLAGDVLAYDIADRIRATASGARADTPRSAGR